MEAINEMRKILLQMSLGAIVTYKNKRFTTERTYEGAIRQMSAALDELEENLKGK